MGRDVHRTLTINLLLVVAATSMARPVSAQDVVQLALDASIKAYEQGELKRAGDKLRTIVRLRKGNAVAHYYLARVYWESPAPDVAKAKEHYGLAMDNGLEFVGQIVRLPDLESAEVAVEEPQVVPPTAPEAVASPATEAPAAGSTEPSPPAKNEILPATPAFMVADASPVSEGSTNEAPEEIVLPDLTDSASEIGRIEEVERRQGEGSLTQSEIRKLHVFRSGIGLCMILIERRELDRAREYADHVIFVAGDHWAGHYLLALIFLEDEDMVEARKAWEMVTRIGNDLPGARYVPTSDYPDLSLRFKETEEQFDDYIAKARALIAQQRWFEADAILMRTQDLANLDFTADRILDKYGGVDCMLGQIALEMEDYDGAVDSFQRARFSPNRQCDYDDGLRRARDGQERIASLPTERSWIPVQPMLYRQSHGRPGTVRLALGRDYLTSEAKQLLGGDRSEAAAEAVEDEMEYLVEGGGAYRVEFDVRRQLWRSVGHGLSAVVLLTVLLAL